MCFSVPFAHMKQVFFKHMSIKELQSGRDCFFKKDPLSVVRQRRGTEPRRAANWTDRQGGREGKVGEGCCSPKHSGEPDERGGAWGLWLLKLPPDVTIQLLQFKPMWREGEGFWGKTSREGGRRCGWRAACVDSERPQQTSLVSSPSNRFTSSKNGAIVPERVLTCKMLAAEIWPASAMSTCMWFGKRRAQ